MPRTTKSATLALERLAEHLGAELTTPRRNRRAVRMFEWADTGTPARVLYSLLHRAVTSTERGGLGQDAEDIREAMSLRPSGVPRGKAHEESLIRSLTVE